MADAADNIVLEHLRVIRGDIAEMKTDLVEIKTRLGHLEGLYFTQTFRDASIALLAAFNRSSAGSISSKRRIGYALDCTNLGRVSFRYGCVP